MEGASGGVHAETDLVKGEGNEAGSSVKEENADEKDNLKDDVCLTENPNLSDASTHYSDGLTGPLAVEDEETMDGGEVAEDEEDEDLSENEDIESPTMDSSHTYLEDMLDTMTENVTTLADTVHTLRNSTGAEPTVALRCFCSNYYFDNAHKRCIS